MEPVVVFVIPVPDFDPELLPVAPTLVFVLFVEPPSKSDELLALASNAQKITNPARMQSILFIKELLANVHNLIGMVYQNSNSNKIKIVEILSLNSSRPLPKVIYLPYAHQNRQL